MKKWELQAVSDGIYYHLDEIINRISELEIEDEKLNLILETANGFAIATAMMILGSERKRYQRSAKSGGTKEPEKKVKLLIEFRDNFKKKYGTTKSWMKQAVKDPDIGVKDPRTIKKLLGIVTPKRIK